VETHRVLLISRPKTSQSAWCPECAAGIAMITPEEAALMTRVNVRAIYRLVEEDLLHFTEPPGGLLLICLSSLLQATGKVEIPREE
jgi:hypothetical protein